MNIPVLDKGHLRLVDAMPAPGGPITMDQAVVQAARASTTKSGNGLKGEAQDKKLLRYLWEHGHVSPFEQAVLKLHVKAPLLVLRQWQRHRSWSFNEQSGRYQEYEDEFYMPSEWRVQSTSNRQRSANGTTVEDLDALANYKIAQEMGPQVMSLFIEEGMIQYKQALKHGIAREQARLFLPAFALYSEMYATANLRSVIHFIQARSSEEAQWEMQQYSNALKQIVQELAPWTAEVAL